MISIIIECLFYVRENHPLTLATVSMCDKSAATPGVWTISYKDNSDTNGFIFSKRDNG